jgi:hypothetical protein
MLKIKGNKMHIVQLKLDDSIYSNVMFLLNNLNLKGLEIKEEELKYKQNNKDKINKLFKSKKINIFSSIDDPIEWQKKQREEW